MSEADSEIRNIPPLDSAPTGTDSKAAKESAAILHNDYAEDGKKRDHNRQQNLKDVAYYGLYAMVGTGILVITSLGIVWAYHLLMPQCWRWLSKDEIDHLQTLLFSGALSAALTLMGKKLF